MQIVGQEIDPITSVDEIITQLKPHRVFPEGEDRAKAFHLSESAARVIDPLTKNPESNPDMSALDSLLDSHLNKPINAIDNVYTHIWDLIEIGRIYTAMCHEQPDKITGYFAKSIIALEAAFNCAQSRHNSFGAYQASGRLYLCISEVLLSSHAQLTADETRKIENIRDFAFKESVQAYVNYGTSFNPNAWRVEQREIGFSSNEPIGTSNLNECISLVVRDPITKKTAVTHIDSNCNIRSLSELFKRMPSHSEQPLEVRIIGAQSQADQNLGRRSIESFRNILGELRKRNVNILSADVLGFPPAEFVVIPETGEIRSESPARLNPNRPILSAKALLDPSTATLQTSFDLTVCPQRVPILISKAMLVGMRNGQTRLSYLRRTQNDEPYIPAYLNFYRIADTAYSAEWTKILSHFNSAADSHKLSDAQRQLVVSALRDIPIFVGENADICNKPLYEMIDNNLWVPEKKGGGKNVKTTFDIRALKAFSFSPPYKYIEAEFGKGFQAKIGTSTPSTTHRVPD